MLRTKKDLTIIWRPSSMPPNFPAHKTRVPKGTQVVELSPGHIVVDHIHHLNIRGEELHDAQHYGIPVPSKDVEEA